ncbi:hypothetical protein B0H16DRAFT_920555 [Mycena metata]|uniref:Uncharacterized protein n=1 Tax=Mycena metata TaxID=1033252 RepID=A0AAD7GFM8_9AGAR|nr:hypothetical protein B0H16DRAFT_920555 [Mycena metata]
MQHRNGAPHITTLVFRIDSAPRGASMLGICSPSQSRRTDTQRHASGFPDFPATDDDHYHAAREEEGACASTAVHFCADSGTALPAHARVHKMPHVHLDAELDEPPPPTRAHDTQRRPPPRQRDRLLEDRGGAGDDAARKKEGELANKGRDFEGRRRGAAEGD